ERAPITSTPTLNRSTWPRHRVRQQSPATGTTTQYGDEQSFACNSASWVQELGTAAGRRVAVMRRGPRLLRRNRGVTSRGGRSVFHGKRPHSPSSERGRSERSRS